MKTPLNTLRNATSGLGINQDRIWRMLNPLDYKTSIVNDDEFILKDSQDYGIHKLVTGLTVKSMLGSNPTYWLRDDDGYVYTVSTGDDIRLTTGARLQFNANTDEIWYSSSNLYFKDATAGTLSLSDLATPNVYATIYADSGSSISASGIDSFTFASANNILGVVAVDTPDTVTFTIDETNIDHDNLTNTHNLTTDIDHDTITNTHNLTTDIDHDTITNTHNLTTDIDHNSINGLQGGTTDEYYHLTATQHSALHGPVTVSDTSTIDLTLSTQQISAAVIPGGVDHDQLLNTHNLTTDIDHDTLTNFVAAEHIDWTSDQGGTNIDVNNIPHSIDDHDDINFTSLSADDIMQWSGSEWVNVTIPTSGSGDSYSTMAGDSGSASASGAETLNVVGDSSYISTAVAAGSPDSITISLDAVDLDLFNDYHRGSIIRGGSSDWEELTVGSSGQYLRTDGTDVSWVSIALTDLGSYTEGSLILGGGTDWTTLSIGANGKYLTSNGTTASWGTISISDVSGGINGSGATNKVAVWSDSNTLTSTYDFSWDGSTLTVNPTAAGAYTAEISQGHTTGHGLRISSAATSASYEVFSARFNSTTDAFRVVGDGSVYFDQLATGGDAEVLTVDSSGVVSTAALSALGGITWDGSGNNKIGTYLTATQIHAEDNFQYDGIDVKIYDGGIKIYSDSGITLTGSLVDSGAGSYLALEDYASTLNAVIRGYSTGGVQAYFKAGDVIFGGSNDIAASTDDHEIWIGDTTASSSESSRLGIIGRQISSSSLVGSLSFHQIYNNSESLDRIAEIRTITGTTVDDGQLDFYTASSGTISKQFSIAQDGGIFAPNMASASKSNLVFYDPSTKELAQYSYSSLFYTQTELGSSGSSSVHWDNITNTPTTLAGYGIDSGSLTLGDLIIDSLVVNDLTATLPFGVNDQEYGLLAINEDGSVYNTNNIIYPVAIDGSDYYSFDFSSWVSQKASLTIVGYPRGDSTPALQIVTGSPGYSHFIDFDDWDLDDEPRGQGSLGLSATGQLRLYDDSDKRLKTNIRNTSLYATNILRSILVMDFDMYRHGNIISSMGYIAQDVEEIYPRMVNYDSKKDLYMVSDGELIPVLHKGWQEHDNEIIQLKEKINKLENLIVELINNK